MIHPMRVVVTGACGSIGSALVERLSSQGHELLVVCRSGDVELREEAPGIELLEADLSIPGEWQARLDGTALVIHLVDPIEELGDLERADEERRIKASMQHRIDSMFQVVWAIEQARLPPQGLVIQSDPRALDDSTDPVSDGYRTLEQLTDPLRRAGTSVLVNRSRDPEAALSILSSSANFILSESQGAPATPSDPVPAGTGTASKPPPRPMPALLLSLDDHLLESGRLVTSGTMLLRRLADHGVQMILTTARSAAEAMAFSDQLGVGDLVIAGDGSALLDVSSREVVRTELLTAEQVMGICLAVRTSESSIGIQVERGRHASCSLPRPVPERLDWLFGKPQSVPFTELLDRPATRILLHGAPRRLVHSVEDIRETWVRQKLVRIVEYDRGCLGVLGATADRIVALQHAEAILGVPRFSSLVFVGHRDRDLLHGWKHSCTRAGMGGELGSRVSFVVPSGTPEETCAFLIEALQGIQPSIAPH